MFTEAAGKYYGAGTELFNRVVSGVQMGNLALWEVMNTPEQLFANWASDLEIQKLPEFVQPLAAELKTSANFSKDKLKTVRGGLNQIVQEWNSQVPEMMNVNEIDSVSDFFKWGANFAAEQTFNTAILFGTGGAALPILSTISYGNKFNQLMTEVDEGLAEYSNLQILGGATVAGLSEGLTEVWSAGVAKRTLGAFKKPKIANSFKKQFASNFKPTKRYIADVGLEGGSEALNEVNNNWYDINILGKKDIHILDNVKTAFIGGGFMSGVLYKSPVVGGSILNTFQSKSFFDK